MNAISKWNPFKEMEELQNRLSSFWGLTPMRGTTGQEEVSLADWAPLVDITEDDKEFLIKADLPEVEKKDVNVRVENGVLYISGERKKETEEKNKKYHRTERYYGSFTRSFTLPDYVDPAKVGAEFKNGVLTVHLLKSEAAKPKAIDIKVS